MKPDKPAGHGEMRRHNLLLVLSNIGGHWPISKPELAEMTGLSWGAVASTTEELLKRGLVQAAKTPLEGLGRNPALFRLRKDARYSLGIDLGFSDVRGVLIDLEGSTVDSLVENSPLGSASPEETIKHCCAMARKIVRKSKLPNGKLLGIGIGIPGSADHEKGICLGLPNLPRWTNVPVAKLVASQLPLPVMLDRRGNCVAYAERHYGAALRLDHAICVSMGEELTAGFILNGVVYRGLGNSAGEIGQMAMTSEPHVARLVERVSIEWLTSAWKQITGQATATLDEIHELAMAGNAKAEELFEELGSILGVALGNLVSLLSPQRIVLGGRLANSRPLFEKAMRESLAKVVGRAAQFDVQTSQLGEMDVAKGAAALLMDRAFSTGEGLLTNVRAVTE